MNVLQHHSESLDGEDSQNSTTLYNNYSYYKNTKVGEDGINIDHSDTNSANLRQSGQKQNYKQQYQQIYRNEQKENINLNQIHQDPLHSLPNTIQKTLGFEKFNRMQKESFNSIFNSNDNCVISAPTGSGKTALFELAISKLFLTYNKSDEVSSTKVLYIAPTKALCFEKYYSWKNKFCLNNITVGLLTSDTDSIEVERVKNSNIIVTTPEKWDLLTRRWFDYIKLFSLVRLLLIDEIHILQDKRGSTLEAVTTRMKRMCKSLRIIALSATVPNIHDISKWIRKDYNSLQPANTLVFGEEYRPVQLSRIVIGLKNSCKNVFQFDFVLNLKLLEIIRQKSLNKPVIVFCPTRKLVSSTAAYLAKHLVTAGSFGTAFDFGDKALAKLIVSGVAYHHAGLSTRDRKHVEQCFINGEIKLLCSTSTLAVGVNLPAYMVIIKGTKFWKENSFEEYSEVDILQMIGRAGRPQYETSGCAAILTEEENKSFYEKLLQGTQELESCLHKNLLENLAAELSLNTVFDVDSAVDWLSSTFFYTRYCSNPRAYTEVEGLAIRNIDKRLALFCEKQLKILQKHEIVVFDIKERKYKSTEFGNSMSKHYVLFETMKHFVECKSKNDLQNIFELMCSSHEFQEYKIKYLEKKLFKEIAGSPLIRFTPPRVMDETNSSIYKVSLLFQFELGGIEFPGNKGFTILLFSFNSEKRYLFQQAPRLLKCLCDVFYYKKDSISLLNTLKLLRTINLRYWEDSVLALQHTDVFNLKNIQKLIKNDVKSITVLKTIPFRKIEILADLKHGDGYKIIKTINDSPKFSIKCDFKSSERSTTNKENLQVTFSVSVKCLNQKQMTNWQTNFEQANVIIETNNGLLIDFKKIPCCKLNIERTFILRTQINKRSSFIRAYVLSENLATCESQDVINLLEIPGTYFKNLVIPRISSVEISDGFSEFEDEDSELDRMFIEFTDSNKPKKRANSSNKKNINKSNKADDDSQCERYSNEYAKKSNGKYECKHICKDKTTCKHFCCRNGMNELPFRSVRKRTANSQDIHINPKNNVTESAQQQDHELKPVAHSSKKLKYESQADFSKLTNKNIEEITNKFNSVSKKINLSQKLITSSLLTESLHEVKQSTINTSEEIFKTNKFIVPSIPDRREIMEMKGWESDIFEDEISYSLKNLLENTFDNEETKNNYMEVNSSPPIYKVVTVEPDTDVKLEKQKNSNKNVVIKQERKIWEIKTLRNPMAIQESAMRNRIERADCSINTSLDTLNSIERESEVKTFYNKGVPENTMDSDIIARHESRVITDSDFFPESMDSRIH